MVADVLSGMVNEHVRRGELQGIKITRHCPEITHCFFADDSLFFIQANGRNCVLLKSIWEEYCEASGQCINWDKSNLFMAESTPGDIRTMVSDILGIPSTTAPGNYLGLPTLWGRAKTEALAFVREKVGKRIQGWSKRFLSQAEKETLIKACKCSASVFYVQFPLS